MAPLRLTRRRQLAVALAPVFVAACGAQENLDELPQTGLSEGKVIYSTWGSTQRRETENWTLLAFEKNYSDLKVDVVWSPSAEEHVARQISLLSGGTPPDVMRLPPWSAPTFYNEEAARRLDAYFRRDGFKPDHLAPPFDVATFKRGWFALPRGLTGTWVIFYNRQLLGQAGLKPPAANWTWDDFLKLTRELTRPNAAGGTQWGTALEPLADFYQPWLWGAGGDEIEPTREASAIEQAPAIEALEWLAELRHKHRVAPPAGELPDALGAFAAGRLATWYGPADAELELNRSRPVDFGIASQPRGKSGQHGGYRPDVMVLPFNAQHPDDGWELLQFLADVETQRLELDNALWLPQSKSITGTEAYQQLTAPPYDRRPGTPGALFRARSPVILPRGDEMRAVTQRELAPFWRGSRSVQDATAGAARAVNAIIKGEAEPPGAGLASLATLAEDIAAALTARSETLAVAETAAGGLIAAALVAVPGASAWFLGGAVAYGPAAKATWLGLGAEAFASQGVVSPTGALALAGAAQRTLGASWGVAEAGIAGPQTGRRSRKTAGLAYVAVSGARTACIALETESDDRGANQVAFAGAALRLLRNTLVDLVTEGDQSTDGAHSV